MNEPFDWPVRTARSFSSESRVCVCVELGGHQYKVCVCVGGAMKWKETLTKKQLFEQPIRRQRVFTWSLCD